MLLSDSSITNLANIITGNSGISPEHTFEEIVKIMKKYVNCESLETFKENLNINSVDDNEAIFKFVVYKLNTINCSSVLTDLIEFLCNNPLFFKDKEKTDFPRFDFDEIMASINSSIQDDNYEVFKAKTKYRVYGLNDSIVDFDYLFCKNKLEAYTAVKDHLDKCYSKVNSGDYSGAITNARTLVEQILREIEVKLDSNAQEYDGNLPKLYKRVMKIFKFEENLPDKIKTIYQQILGGLSGSVNGFSGLRNTMSDSHPVEHIPSENDAILAINESKTLANFIVRHYFEHYVNAT